MKKSIALVGLSTVIILGLVSVFVNQNENQLSEAEIRQKFRCDRISTEVLATDSYCSNLDYYYEDVANNNVLGEDDFDDPRYEARIREQVTKRDYNPNYADAIQLKKPELCSDIKYALQSGPTDAIQRLYGGQAKSTCERQAKAGFFGCECDSEAVLNAMRDSGGQ